jgi:para-aminobenzoate synthetase component 1
LSDLTIIPLPYKDNLISHYQSLKDLPGFVLLESGDRRWGRYDILSACPYSKFTTSDKIINFQDVLGHLKKQVPFIPSKLGLPFQGGAIGYFSYDFGATQFDLYADTHPCNEMPSFFIGLYDWAIVADHKQKEVNLIAANTQAVTAELIAEVKTRWQMVSHALKAFKLEKSFSPLISKADYRQAFATIHQSLREGRAYQVNYTQPFLAEYSGDSWEMYKRVRINNPVPYAAYLSYPESQILSFSPERFLKMEQGYALTSPIKGTMPRSFDNKEDEKLRLALLNSIKNRAENIMIVDLVRNDLSKFAKPGSVNVPSLCEAQSFKNVHHLVSHIKAECNDGTHPLDGFAACFPGGSITGAPKREAMRVIHENEPFARGIYCGSVAYLSNHGRFDSNIAIRTLVAKSNSLYLSTGGGLVIDSQWEDEYRECFTKIAAIVNSCQLS